MFKEDPAPMTAHESGAETIFLKMEVGGDEGKDIQWDTVDGSKGVLPFTDGPECGRNIPLKLRDRVQGEAMEVFNASFFKNVPSTYHEGCSVSLSFSLRAKTSCASDRPFPG